VRQGVVRKRATQQPAARDGFWQRWRLLTASPFPLGVDGYFYPIQLRSLLERGRETRAVDYQRALRRIRPMVESFDELFMERYDAILTPAAPGPAPRGLSGTGDPSFCTLWTLCGMPALSLPLLRGSDGLPLGVQLVGRRGFDARLLRTARWLVEATR